MINVNPWLLNSLNLIDWELQRENDKDYADWAKRSKRGSNVWIAMKTDSRPIVSQWPPHHPTPPRTPIKIVCPGFLPFEDADTIRIEFHFSPAHPVSRASWVEEGFNGAQFYTLGRIKAFKNVI